MKNIQIIYFSGTGGTKKVALHLQQRFKAGSTNCVATELDLHKNDYLNENILVENIDCLILLYPVFAFDAPPPVYDFLNRLPSVKETPAAVLSVSGGGEGCPNTACRRGSIRLLESKGFKVFYERMFIMPANVLVKPREDLMAWLIKVLPEKAANCADEILHSTYRRIRPDFLSVLLTKMTSHKSFNKFGQYFITDDRCTGCGWCESNCPRKNIKITEGRPVYADQCTLCMRCIYGCPRKAISADKYKSIVLKTGFDIAELEKRLGQAELIPLNKLKTGFTYYFYRKYLKDARS